MRSKNNEDEITMERLTEKGDRFGSYYTYKSDNEFSTKEYDKHTEKVYNKLGKLEDIEEKYSVNEDDIEVALIVKKIIENGYVYYEDNEGKDTYWFGVELEFDFEKNEIILIDNYDNDYSSYWEERTRLSILDYKKTFWLKENKSE